MKPMPVELFSIFSIFEEESFAACLSLLLTLSPFLEDLLNKCVIP